MGQTNRRPRVWCYKYYFFYTFCRLRALKTFYFCIFIKNKKINWKNFCKEFCKKSWKKIIILGASDAWSTIPLSYSSSNSVHYIVNWRIFRLTLRTILFLWGLRHSTSVFKPSYMVVRYIWSVILTALPTWTIISRRVKVAQQPLFSLYNIIQVLWLEPTYYYSNDLTLKNSSVSILSAGLHLV